MLLRGPALPAGPSAVARVLHEAGYETEEVPTQPHPDKVRRFERARPNQLWQTDLFTFVLKRQNRRVYLVAFMDDHSRFMVGYGLHASQSSALVMEVLRAAITSYGTPQEILTDNGSQYVTWRGKSAFSKELDKRGIRQVVARPRHPQTLGKIERFWGTLWRECVGRRSSSTWATPSAASASSWTITTSSVPTRALTVWCRPTASSARRRGAANAQGARGGQRPGTGPPWPAQASFYLTGQVGGQPFSVHAEGEPSCSGRASGDARRSTWYRRGQPRRQARCPAVCRMASPAIAPLAGAADEGRDVQRRRPGRRGRGRGAAGRSVTMSTKRTSPPSRGDGPRPGPRGPRRSVRAGA